MSTIVTGACSGDPARLSLADMPAIDTARVLADIRTLSSDAFGGRAPGSPGEDLTVQYLIDRFADAGAEPGNPDGSWTQHVPLVGITPNDMTPLSVRTRRGVEVFAPHEDVVAFSERVTESVDLSDSEMVFAGYGVQAPEYGWDDFKGIDVRGKTLVVLVNDPPVPLDPARPEVLDPEMFNGRTMTYYGRWTYKFEKATELGAAAIFIVHETGPAGYAFNIVQGFEGERFHLVKPDRSMGAPVVEGWLSVAAATRLLSAAGHDFETLKARARTKSFAPVSLDLKATMGFRQSLRTVDSRNVIARVTGSNPALRDEFVVYLAHWDHLGTSATAEGDRVFNGARDNASGTALLLELARAFTAVRPAAERTILFLAVTAEEQGLLGSAFYAASPLYPLQKTLAVINMDEINVWGRTRDLTVIGLGSSELDEYARRAAAEQGRTVRGDAEPEKGFYFRSDHFSFAKVGVPALNTDSGIDFLDKAHDYGTTRRDEWNNTDYHQPTDQVKAWWDLRGTAEDGRLFFAVGYRVANAASFPAWLPTSEFRAIRERSLGTTR
jgi:Zn-dependent M28 family amino/carboxypeptidase